MTEFLFQLFIKLLSTAPFSGLLLILVQSAIRPDLRVSTRFASATDESGRSTNNYWLVIGNGTASEPLKDVVVKWQLVDPAAVDPVGKAAAVRARFFDGPISTDDVPSEPMTLAPGRQSAFCVSTDGTESGLQFKVAVGTTVTTFSGREKRDDAPHTGLFTWLAIVSCALGAYVLPRLAQPISDASERLLLGPSPANEGGAVAMAPAVLAAVRSALEGAPWIGFDTVAVAVVVGVAALAAFEQRSRRQTPVVPYVHWLPGK